MKQFFSRNLIRNFLLFIISLLILNGCGDNGANIGGNATGSNPYYKGIKIPANDNYLNFSWSFDGYKLPPAGYVVNDMVWHLVTVTVVDHDTPLANPIAIKGLQASIYPVPTDNRGESVEIADINCDTAMFSKTGDTCSAYIRSYYNVSTGTSNPPVIQIQLTTNAYDSGETEMVYFVERALFSYPSGDYRAVLPIENKYYVGSAVKSSPTQYTILDMKNVTYPALTITTLSTPTNPNIQLMNRQTAESNDPYYGPYSQCSLTANPNLKQVNYLPSVGSECILVYQAPLNSTGTVESDNITLSTNSGVVSPWTANNLKLTATYVHESSIPTVNLPGQNFQVISGQATPNASGMYMISDGVLSTGIISPSPEPFKLINIRSFFQPNMMQHAPYGIPYYQNGKINVADQNIRTPIHNGDKILTDASTTNPVTVGTSTQQVAGGTASGSNSVQACGGAWASSSAQIDPGNTSLAYNGQVHLVMNNNSNSSCGGETPNHFEADIPFSGYNATVYSNDEQGCGGNQWNIGATINVNSQGCSDNNCTYKVSVTATHGGINGQCHDSQTSVYYLIFQPSIVYTQFSSLQNFTNPNSRQPTFVARGGQNIQTAMIGNESGLVSQKIYCGKYAQCHIEGIYSNGLSSMNMLYNIALDAGDNFAGGSVDLAPSQGYELTGFTSSR